MPIIRIIEELGVLGNLIRTASSSSTERGFRHGPFRDGEDGIYYSIFKCEMVALGVDMLY